MVNLIFVFRNKVSNKLLIHLITYKSHVLIVCLIARKLDMWVKTFNSQRI